MSCKRFRNLAALIASLLGKMNCGCDSAGFEEVIILQMLSRSAAPDVVVDGLAALLPEAQSSEISGLFIVADPGDEIVAAGGS